MSKVILSKDTNGVLNVRSSSIADAQDVYTAKAWVNFDGTGTVAIREAGNVSSITDNGTGNYTINFINDMVDANYAVTGISYAQTSSSIPNRITNDCSLNTVSGYTIKNCSGNQDATSSVGVYVDGNITSVVFR